MRNLFRATVPILILLLSFVYVSAHSGRTDSNGGHYNRSTGEYHYHHGYSAHGHYDMDKDGIAGCPYDFEDKTNHSSGGDIGSNVTQITPPSDKLIPSEGVTFTKVLSAMFKFLLPAVGVGLAAAYLLSHLFILIFGDEKGCSISLISIVILSIVAYVWFIVTDLS